MRVYVFLLGQKSDIVNWVQSDTRLRVRNHPSWEYTRLMVGGIDGVQFIVNQVHAQAYQLIPESSDWKLVCKVVRRMKAAAPPSVKVVSRKWIKQNYPVIFQKIFNQPQYDNDGNIVGYDDTIERCPLIIAGDQPTAILDYDPTEDDIANDTDPEPGDIGVPTNDVDSPRLNVARVRLLRFLNGSNEG